MDKTERKLRAVRDKINHILKNENVRLKTQGSIFLEKENKEDNDMSYLTFNQGYFYERHE